MLMDILKGSMQSDGILINLRHVPMITLWGYSGFRNEKIKDVGLLCLFKMIFNI